MSIAFETPFTGSIDTIGIVQNCESTPWPDELLRLGFENKPGRYYSTKTWFRNAMDSQYEPRILFYQTRSRCWRHRVDLSIPNLLFGDNILLPSHSDIREGIASLSSNVELLSGMPFDAFAASVCRVDYAVNIRCDRDLITPLIAYYARYNIPRLLRKTVASETVYFDNDSRGIRLYDKRAEITANHGNKPDRIEKAKEILRAEYYFLKAPSVNRFVKERGLSDSTVRTIISPHTIELATNELIELLKLDKVDLSDGDDFRSILAKSGDVKKAIGLYGFKSAVNALGEDFYRDPSHNYSKSTYDRNRRQCQSIGISL